MSSNPVDLLPQVRIRTAALELFAQQGFERATVRQVAQRADVSPGLVMHHYGSKQGLRDACDAWVVEALSDEQTMIALTNLPSLQDYLAAHPELRPLTDYLVASLREGGDVASHLFDRMLALTDTIMATAEQAGVVHLPDDRQAALAILVTNSLGSLVLSDQLARAMGGTSLFDPDVLHRYGMVGAELYTHGIFTPDYLDALRAANPA